MLFASPNNFIVLVNIPCTLHVLPVSIFSLSSIYFLSLFRSPCVHSLWNMCTKSPVFDQHVYHPNQVPREHEIKSAKWNKLSIFVLVNTTNNRHTITIQSAILGADPAKGKFNEYERIIKRNKAEESKVGSSSKENVNRDREWNWKRRNGEERNLIRKREREKESTRYRVHISREKNIYLRDFRIVYFLYDSIFLSFYPEWKIMVWKSYLDSFASYGITHTRTHKNRLDIFPEVCNKSLTFNDFRNSTSKFFPWKLSWIQIYLQNRIRPSG